MLYAVFVQSYGKLLLLVCQETIAVLKIYNLKRHYQYMKPSITVLETKKEKKKIKQLTKLVHQQQTAITKI